MSSGLMSCVRENSPPLELDAAASGPLSLPETHSSGISLMGTTSTPVAASLMTTAVDGAAPNAEQKRRRFHPLRNLRRIFRRRTITSVVDTPSNTSLPNTSSSSATRTPTTVSEKNLRSATLSSIASVVSASASSPSSPLTHAQLQDAYSSQSLPKSKSYSNAAAHEHRAHRADATALLSKNNKLQLQQQRRGVTSDAHDAAEMYATTTTTSSASASYHHGQSQRFAYMSGVDGLGGAPPRQSLGVAVFPAAMNRSFFAERQKLRSVGDSSLDLDSSGNDSGSHTGRSSNTAAAASSAHTANGGAARANGGGGGSASGGEMSDSQRSLSEGRLVDSDYTRDQLSQSHDSVFSESATASSLSIVLKAELADVLRKRRNRPDASDEDLGLPRSPASPQRRAEHHSATNGNGAHNHTNASNTTGGGGNQSEVSSLSLLSMNSTDGEEASGTANSSAAGATEAVQERTLSSTRYARSSTMSSISVASDILRHSSSASFNDAKDEVDLFSSDWQRLSHAAAKHKMAVRPAKKKVPSRLHRRTLETSIPEANEESLKLGVVNHLLDVVDHDAKAKTRSLPPGVNAKLMEQHVAETKKTTTTAKTASAATTTISTTTSNSDLAIKRSKNERGPTVVVATGASNSKLSTTNTTITTTTSSGSITTTNLFGLRALSSKAAAMFEPKETAVPTANETEKPKKAEDTSSTVTSMETTESGFLRRLMQRNSKRTIAKAREGDKDDLDLNQSEPKKLQISSSTYDAKAPAFSLPVLDKCRSEMTYEQNIEETRKEIKREIMSEGKSGLSAMLNNFMSSEKAQVTVKDSSSSALQKPKSGPAARQRYLPQEIIAGNTLEKKTISPAKESPTSSGSLLLTSKHTLSQETFQSTSIIREITASQLLSVNSATSMASSARAEHHFEKKPKIVGLSAFQQKITRSNDSFARTSSSNTSSNSLETVGTESLFASYEQKQRRSVEKSRSFRTYNEETSSSPTVHSNMPSLPDLSLNLRVPCFGEFILNEKEYSSPSPPEPDSHDKSVSLGFEINDNNLVRPALRAESASHLLGSQSSYAKNIILTTAAGSGKSSSTKLLAPASGMPSLSPTTSCNNNISEIEQNIDLIVKSPYVSVLRKSANITDEMLTRIPPTVGLSSPSKSEQALEQVMQSVPEKLVRPKVLNLKERITVCEEKLTTPTTAAVPLREKSSKVLNTVRSSVEVAPKQLERKSAPVSQASAKTNVCKTARRSSSVIESAAAAVSEENIARGVPEFMKIQLNRVDPVRSAKSTVVLSKNVKESPSPILPAKDSSAEKSASIDDLSLRRYSNESVDITEKETPDMERRISDVFEAINKQAKAVSSGSIQHTNNNNNANDQLPPRSPVKKSPVAALISPISNEEVAVLRPKTSETSATKLSVTAANNKLSLQERKRLFMSEDRSKAEKKMEDLRNERKKSITEEVYRKNTAKSEERLEQPNAPIASPSPSAESVEFTPAAAVVVLRKKSFGAVSQATSALNGNAIASSTVRSNDPTPELMKVFARRSLKIKDEDLNAFQEKLNTHQTSTTSITTSSSSATHSSSTTSVKKFASSTAIQSQQNVDSDKENQSSSEEKLNKLPKFEVAIEQSSTINKVSNSGTQASISTTTMGSNGSSSNRNSVADFRATKHAIGNSNGLTVSNNNNNNNNMTISTATTTTAVSNGKSFLPPLRVGGGFRTMPIERNGSVNKLFGGSAGAHNNSESLNNNNNNSLNSNGGVTRAPPLERQSLNIKSSESASSGFGQSNNKTIERSATVGEFKGIHQRRAEWEQRAKEALK